MPALTPLDKSVRELRAVARCMTLSRELGDDLCEETLLAFLAADPPLDTGTDYVPEFVRIMRRIYGSGMFVNQEKSPKDPALLVLSHLPIARREIIALHLGGNRKPEEIAVLLQIDNREAALEIAKFASQVLTAFSPAPAAAA